MVAAKDRVNLTDPAAEPRTAKLKNIVGNPHKFNFKELDLLTMPREFSGCRYWRYHNLMP